MRLEIKVTASSTQHKIVPYGDRFKAYLRSAPEKGKANKELLELVAENFGVSKSAVRIIRGETSQNKILEVAKK